MGAIIALPAGEENTRAMLTNVKFLWILKLCSMHLLKILSKAAILTPDVRCQPNRKLSSFRFFRFSAEKTVHPHRFLTISTVFEAFDKKKVEIRSERNDFFSNFAIVYNTLISTHMTTNNYKTPFQQGGGNYEAPELTIATVSIEKGFAATEPNSNAPLEDESYE